MPICNMSRPSRNIGHHMTEYKVIVDKSTVPVGTEGKARAALAEESKCIFGTAPRLTYADSPMATLTNGDALVTVAELSFGHPISGRSRLASRFPSSSMAQYVHP